MKEDDSLSMALSGATLSASGMLFLLLASNGLSNDDLLMLTRTLALSATLVPIIGMGVPDLIKLDLSGKGGKDSLVLIRKYTLYVLCSFAFISFTLSGLFLYGKLGVYQNKLIIFLALFISIATVIYNSISCIFISKMKYYSELKFSVFHSMIKILLIFFVLSLESSWITASLSWVIALIAASFFGILGITKILDIVDSSIYNPHDSPLSLGLVSSFVNSRVRFLSFAIPILTSHMTSEDQAMAYILWTIFVGTLFIPNAHSTDILIKMKNKMKKPLIEYFYRGIAFSIVLTPAIFVFVILLGIESSTGLTPTVIFPWAFLNVTILYEYITKIRHQALNMKKHLIFFSIMTIAFVSIPISVSNNIGEIGFNLLFWTSMLSLTHHAYNQFFLKKKLKTKGFD